MWDAAGRPQLPCTADATLMQSLCKAMGPKSATRGYKKDQNRYSRQVDIERREYNGCAMYR